MALGVSEPKSEPKASPPLPHTIRHTRQRSQLAVQFTAVGSRGLGPGLGFVDAKARFIGDPPQVGAGRPVERS